MRIDSLLELVKPLESVFAGAWGPSGVEAFLMGCARRGEVALRVDHLSGCITFIDDAFGSSEAGSSKTASTSSSTIQPSSNDLVRTRLSTLATCLWTSLQQIDPPPSQPAVDQEALMSAALAERKALQVRRAIVARRREWQEEHTERQKKEEDQRRAEAEARERLETQRRILEEARKKEHDRLIRDMEKTKHEEAIVLAKSLKEKGALKVDISVSK